MNKRLLSNSSYQPNATLYGVASIPTNYSKEIGVLFIGGFERSGNEQKRRILSQALYAQGITSLQFDMTGLGQSTGLYNNPVMDNLIYDTNNMLEVFKEKTGISNFCIVGHSLGACVALMISKQRSDISKLVFLAPALNQQILNRYWHTMNTNKDIDITFENYTTYHKEEEYQQQIHKPTPKKANIIDPSYMVEMSEQDYTIQLPQDTSNILVIQGDKDNVTPPQSQPHFANIITVKGGDHDMEKPWTIGQWVDKTVDFIKN